MKRRDLIRQLRAIAAAAEGDLEFIRERANHEVWSLGGERLVIPRHREVNEHTARAIIKRAKEVTTGDK